MARKIIDNDSLEDIFELEHSSKTADLEADLFGENLLPSEMGVGDGVDVSLNHSAIPLPSSDIPTPEPPQVAGLSLEASNLPSLVTKDEYGQTTGVDLTNVYRQYHDVAEMTKNTMAQLHYLITINPLDKETYSAFTDVAKTLNSTMREFTKVSSDQLSHQRKMELEELKHTHRIALEQMKMDNRSTPIKGGISLEGDDITEFDPDNE